MKFCSVGALKHKNERSEADMIQFMFDKNTARPTDVASLMQILPEVRSISFDKSDNNLSCSALAGYLSNRLYLSCVNIPNFNYEANSYSLMSPVSGGSRTQQDLFYIFCCIYNGWNTVRGLSGVGTGSILDADYLKFEKTITTNPFGYRLKDNSLGSRWVFYPAKLSGKGTGLQTNVTFNMSASQTFSSSSSYNNGTTTTYTSYSTYLASVSFNLAGVYTSQAVANYGTVASGAQTLPLSKQSQYSCFQIIRPTRYYSYSSGSSSSNSYSNGAYIASAATNNETTVLPFITLAGTDETVELGFSVIATRERDKSNIFIRDFGTDLTQSGSQVPNTVPTIQLNTKISLDSLSPVLSL